MRTLLKLLLTAALLCGSAWDASALKREFRSVWMAGMGIDWPHTTGTSPEAQAAAKKELTDYLDSYQRENFTGVCIHVRPLADAFYRSTLEPWSASVSGKRGVDPGWDPLEFAVEECHKRGLECYAWVNPFRITASGATYTDSFYKQWEANGWILTSGDWKIFNPALEGARQHSLDVIKEIYTNYAIDGLLFDDYFYPGSGMASDSSAGDYQQWKDSGTTMSIADWRRNNVNTFVKAVYDQIQADRPDMRFGIGPAGVSGTSAPEYGLSGPGVGSDWPYSKIYCDPLAWMADGSIDFIAPQIYWSRKNASAPYTPLCQWWSMVANHFGIHNYVSIAAYKVTTDEFGGNNSDGWSEIAEQVSLCRAYAGESNAPGQIYYSARFIDGPSYRGMGDYLLEHRYTTPVLSPAVTWKDHPTYAAVDAARLTDGKLAWSAPEADEQAIIRYSVYAIPLSVNYDQAMAEDGDGIDGQYLLGVTYEPSYTLPAEVQGRFWYAVCVLDGYSIEYAPALVNYTGEQSGKPELLTPATDGTVADWDFTMTWTEVPGATYTAQIARDINFASIILEQKDITATSATFALDKFNNNTLNYCRVVASEPSKLVTPSEVRSFYSPTRTTPAQPALLNHVDGEIVSDSHTTFAWEAVQDAETYIVMIARDGDFFNPVFKKSIKAPTTEITLPTASLGYGSFAWRVWAYGSRFNAVGSDDGLFSIVEPATGSYEQGYTIATDPAEYAAASGCGIESLWMRSTALGNIAFDSDGSLNRSMAASRDFVFIAGRSTNAEDADIYIDQYSLRTGEHLRRIALSDEGKVPSLPCNTVLLDEAGHLCIANQTTKSTSNHIFLYQVELGTGQLSLLADLRGSKTVVTRIDHIALYGDVTSSEYYVFGAVSGKGHVARWTVTDEEGVDPECEVIKVGEFASGASTFGTAPIIYAIDEDWYIVDGGNTAPAMYSFSDNKLLAKAFDESQPVAVSENGFSVGDFGQETIAAYPCTAPANGAQFAIANISEVPTLLWTVPAAGLGTTDSGTNAAPTALVEAADGTLVAVVYSPGNGLAAYRITDGAAVCDISADTVSYRLDGLTLTLSQPATVEIYTAAGQLLTRTTTDRATLPSAGLYIAVINGRAHKLLAR